jgi:hypothetical protein
MARLVNYGKRGISLPAGCKDLIDLLDPSKRKANGPHLGGEPAPTACKHDRFPKAGLAQVARYIAMSVESPAEVFLLYICSLDEELAVGIRRNKGPKTFELVPMRFVSTDVSRHTEIEQSVRAFCEQQGIQPIGHRPVVYSLPIDASLVSELTIRLLRMVYGLNDESGLIFYYFERPAAI